MDIRPPPHVMAWLGPLILVNVFFWVIVGTPEIRDPICAGSENCLTDWVGAMSGWIAAGAAYLTIKAMAAQREEAAIHQREFVELEIMARIALARRFERKFRYRSASFQAVADRLVNADDLNELATILSSFRGHMDTMQEDFTNPLMIEFDEKIGLRGNVTATTVTIAAERADDAIERFLQVAPYPNSLPEEFERTRVDALKHVRNAYRRAIRFYGDAIADAKSFDTKWQARISL